MPARLGVRIDDEVVEVRVDDDMLRVYHTAKADAKVRRSVPQGLSKVAESTTLSR